jgi:hypothetical protein
VSLDISKLEHVRTNGAKTTARCPVCAQAGHDRKGDHLIIQADGRFGCVVYPGNGPDAKEHRRRIFALCGDRETKPLIIRRATETVAPGRSGRPFPSHSKAVSIKTGLLGRLGRAFSTHAQRNPAILVPSPPIVQHNDIKNSVPAVLESDVKLNRTLTERELLLLRRAGAQNDPIIITALNLFNARITE